MSSERRLLVLSLVAGVLLRIIHTATSLGSLDALLWYRWVELIERVGVLRSYLYSDLMNHPPFVLVIARATNAIGVWLGLEFSDSFRLLQTAADVVTLLLLVRIAKRLRLNNPHVPALIFFLSPAAIFITGFHCNSDPLMMMFLALAVAAVLEQRPLPAGLAFAAAIGVKILPLLVAPFLLLALRDARARIRFLITTTIAGALIFVPGFVVSGPLFLKQIFGYTGMPTGWGLRAIGQLVRIWTGWSGLTTATSYAGAATIIAVVGLWIAEWWRRRATGAFDAARLPALIAATYLIVLVIAPGFGVQYLFWLLPFLAFAVERRLTLLLHGLAGVFIFAVYTLWAHGWPWWFADGEESPEAVRMLAWLGIVVWGAIAFVAIRALARLYRSDHSSSSSSPPALLYFFVLL